MEKNNLKIINKKVADKYLKINDIYITCMGPWDFKFNKLESLKTYDTSNNISNGLSNDSIAKIVSAFYFKIKKNVYCINKDGIRKLDYNFSYLQTLLELYPVKIKKCEYYSHHEGYIDVWIDGYNVYNKYLIFQSYNPSKMLYKGHGRLIGDKILNRIGSVFNYVSSPAVQKVMKDAEKTGYIKIENLCKFSEKKEKFYQKEINERDYNEKKKKRKEEKIENSKNKKEKSQNEFENLL
ncbi:MAG TPA: hypothetical protein DCO89_01525 [Clostridiales bacterium]|nr:hypothetical protein [Clostridiales bacterium]